MHPSQFMQPQIVLLKQGTDTSQGKAQLISNINACHDESIAIAARPLACAMARYILAWATRLCVVSFRPRRRRRREQQQQHRKKSPSFFATST